MRTRFFIAHLVYPIPWRMKSRKSNGERSQIEHMHHPVAYQRTVTRALNNPYNPWNPWTTQRLGDIFPFSVFNSSFDCRQKAAKMEPEMLCHTLKIAPGTAANGIDAK